MERRYCNIDGYDEPCVFNCGNIEDCPEAIKLKSQGLDQKECFYWTTDEIISSRVERMEENIRIRSKIYEDSIKLREERDRQQSNLIKFLVDGYNDRFEEGYPRYIQRKEWKKKN